MRYLVTVLFLVSSVFRVSAQTEKTRQIDEFGKITCDDFDARMDGIFTELENATDAKIYVIFYGERYRRTSSGWNKKTKDFESIKLDYPNRDDGLNWAKSIPLYLTTYKGYPTTSQNLLKDKIVLINGGFRENLEVEIWLVPKNGEIPKATPAIDEKDIKFRKDKPYQTPNFTACY